VGAVLGAFLLFCILVIFFLLRRREQTETGDKTVPVDVEDTVPVKSEMAAAPLDHIPVIHVDGDAEVGGRLRYPEEVVGGRLRYPNDDVDLGGRLMSS
jgi:hypothetical protein